MGDNNAARETPQANWRASLTKAARFSKLQFANCWRGISRVWRSIVQFSELQFANCWRGISRVWLSIVRFSELQFTNCWRGISRVWLNIVRFPKLFEALLVSVGLLQGYVLWRTDQALHLAAKAQQEAAGVANKMRVIIEATERPWIGPNGARIEGTLETGKRISTTVPYQNTGRQPSPLLITTSPKLFTREQFEKITGDVTMWIFAKQQSCMATAVPWNFLNTRVAYPTIGFSTYLLHVDSDDASLVPRDRFLATDKFMSGDEIFVFVGCFVYGTTETPHHSSFCFFYDHKVSDIHSLPYCLTGQRAD
jgi:hypothetical protein